MYIRNSQHQSGRDQIYYHHHHHLSLNHEGRWGTTDDFVTSFLYFSLFSTALWVLANSRPVHSLMLSSLLFLCLPCLLPPFTVPCKMVLARPDELETWPYHCSLRLFTIVRRSSCCPIACWIRIRNQKRETAQMLESARKTLTVASVNDCVRMLISMAQRSKIYSKNLRVITALDDHVIFTIATKMMAF